MLWSARQSSPRSWLSSYATPKPYKNPTRFSLSLRRSLRSLSTRTDQTAQTTSGRRRTGDRQIIVAEATATDGGTYPLRIGVKADLMDRTGRRMEEEDRRDGIRIAEVRVRVLGGGIVIVRRMCR